MTTYYNVTSIIKELELKEKLGKLHDSEKWMTPRNLPLLLSLALVAAFIGQMFGLGGGFIYGPVLITLGVNPIVNSATLLYMIIFSSAASMFMFMIFGKLNIAFTLWIALYAGAGVVLGLFVMKELIKRYKRPSLVAFALAIAIIISNIFSIYSGVKSIKL